MKRLKLGELLCAIGSHKWKSVVGVDKRGLFYFDYCLRCGHGNKDRQKFLHNILDLRYPREVLE
jgi:hypothetical protein